MAFSVVLQKHELPIFKMPEEKNLQYKRNTDCWISGNFWKMIEYIWKIAWSFALDQEQHYFVGFKPAYLISNRSKANSIKNWKIFSSYSLISKSLKVWTFRETLLNTHICGNLSHFLVSFSVCTKIGVLKRRDLILRVVNF